MNSEVKGLLVSLVALIVAGGMSAFNFSETSEIKETQAEIVIKQETLFTDVDVWRVLKQEQAKLNGLIAMPKPYSDYDLQIRIHELEVLNKHLTADLNDTRTNLQLINNKIRTVEALQKQITQAVPQEEEMFSLVLLKSDGNLVPNGEFLQSQTVYFSGKYDGKDTNYDLLIKRAGQLVLKKMELNMPTDGVFSYYFNLEHDQPLGSYTATVVINGKIDTISFQIK